MMESELTFSVSVPSRGDSSPVAAASAARLLAPSANCRQSSGPAAALDVPTDPAEACSLVGEGDGGGAAADAAGPAPAAAAPAAAAALALAAAACVPTIGALAGLAAGVAGREPAACAVAEPGPSRRPVAAIQARLSR